MAIAFGSVISVRSNNWYKKQGQEFDSQCYNCSGRDSCRLHNCPVA